MSERTYANTFDCRPELIAKWLSFGYHIASTRSGGEHRCVLAPKRFWELPRIAILSSRMPADHTGRTCWLRAFKAVVDANAGRAVGWLTAPHTACDRWLLGAMETRDQPLWRCDAGDVRNAEPFRGAAGTTNTVAAPIFFPPKYGGPAAKSERGRARDADLVDLADELYVLHVRRRGRVSALLQQLAADGSWPEGLRGWYCDDPGLVPIKLREQLPLQLQAWWPEERSCGANVPAVPRDCSQAYAGGDEQRAASDVKSFTACRDFFCEPTLSHWTRAPGECWPDETPAQAVRRQLAAPEQPPPSPLDALLRIVTQRRIVASAHLNRSRTPVVCFTAHLPGEFSNLRCFRPHLRRWDFEPYGISIRRAWLERFGTKPVIYGTNELWTQLDAARRPYFQTTEGGMRGGVDWQGEFEWRCCGDVSLSELPSEAARLFVPHLAQAQVLARCSPWPVMYFN
ncbi:MAG: hypothetical protein KDB23_23465 [Planctomycetales bacterium]|nr:hypothetical protein [Planctomycetales bacterium]